jgi:hypothetical protein
MNRSYSKADIKEVCSGPDECEVWVSFSARQDILFFFRVLRTALGVHQLFYPTNIEGTFLEGKAAIV